MVSLMTVYDAFLAKVGEDDWARCYSKEDLECFIKDWREFLNSAISTISGTEITTYPASLYYLKTTKLYDHGNTGVANETLFELLQNNMKFYF